MKQRYGTLIMALIMLTLIGIRHADWLSAPAVNYIGDSHDGIRSHGATLYHVLYDSTYSWYMGMNYPYGDRAAFSDCQPVWTNTVKFIHEHIHPVPVLGPTLIHFMILFSLFLAGLVLYLLFQKLKLPVAYSIFLAIGITFLSPQLDRFGTHYGLAYAGVIPIGIYLLYSFEQEKTWRWSCFTCLFLVLISWIHFYLFALVFFVISIFYFFRVLFECSVEKIMFYSKHWLLQCFVPFLAIQLWMMYIDPVADRPSFPYGFDVYIAYWQSVLFSPSTWLGRNLIDLMPKVRFWTLEGNAWIGSMAGLLMLIAGISGIIKLFKKQKIEWGTSKDRSFLLHLLATGFLILLMSFCIPFIWAPFDGLENYTGPYRQFRSLGRFAWVFVYVSNIVFFYWLYQKYKQTEQKKWGLAVLVFALGILNYEAFIFSESTRVQQKVVPELSKRQGFKVAEHPWLNQINPSDYQAILPIPYYHIGSENFWISIKGDITHHNLMASLHTGLPLMSSFLGRTSISQTLNQLEFVSEPYRYPEIIADFPNDKPILVQVTNKYYQEIWDRYEHLFYGLDPFYEDETTTLYRLPLWRFRNRIQEKRQWAVDEMNQVTLYNYGNILSKDSTENFIYKSFDQEQADISYRGNALAVPGAEGKTLFEGTLPEQKENFTYVFSIWTYGKIDLHPKSLVHILEKDSTGQLQHLHFQNFKNIRSIDNGWMLIDIPFRLKSSNSQIEVRIDNPDLRKQFFYIDEFQIRPHNASLFRKTETELVRNNRWYPQ